MTVDDMSVNEMASYLANETMLLGLVKNCNNYSTNYYLLNRTALILHQCMKTNVLSCHRYLIKTGVEKMNNI